MFLKHMTTIRVLKRCLTTSSAKESIGFIGLGNMGYPMTKNLINSINKCKLYLCEPSKKVVDEVKKTFPKEQFHFCESPSQVAQMARLIFTMLPDDEIVESVYLGKAGLIESLTDKSLCIDSSTISPLTSEMIAQKIFSKCKANFIDAPVSGGVPGAQNATLTFMAGGNNENVKKADSIIVPAMGKKLFHCGEKVGSGLIAKLCNNMLLAICMIGTSEALNMGKRLGLDPKILTDIINTSTGRNWCSETYNPVPGMLKEPQYQNIPPNKNYEGGFRVALMCKDLTIGQNIAGKNNIFTPLGGMSHQMYKLLNANNVFKHKDFAYVYPMINGNLFN